MGNGHAFTKSCRNINTIYHEGDLFEIFGLAKCLIKKIKKCKLSFWKRKEVLEKKM